MENNEEQPDAYNDAKRTFGRRGMPAALTLMGIAAAMGVDVNAAIGGGKQEPTAKRELTEQDKRNLAAAEERRQRRNATRLRNHNRAKGIRP